MKKIGAKSTSKTRYKGTAYKCDLCGRKFMSIDALKSHQRSVHNLQPDKSRIRQYGKQAKKPEVKEKPVKKSPVIETSSLPYRTTRTRTEQARIEPKSEQTTPSSTVEYECPKCFKSFLTHFLATRHIQKFHSINKKGAKVSPNSSTVIHPERKELCLKCNRKVKSIPSHICGITNKMVEEEGLVYNCTGCDTRFLNKRSFYSHVITSHPDGVESLFFPTNTDFLKWKEEMELETKTKFSEVDKFDSKCYYHCGYKSGNLAKASINICPSLMVIQEFTKGIQVHYYKKHFRHVTVDYTLLKKYKKFSITAFLKSSDGYFDLTDVKCDDNDMYIQFKKLMESIVLDAAKLNSNALKVLFGKALEMTSILTSYDDELSDDGTKPPKQNMTDLQITKALEDPSPRTENIDDDQIEPMKKKAKKIDESEAPSPKIINSFSLAVNENYSMSNSVETPSIKVKDISILQATTESKKTNEESIKNDSIKVDNTPSSFNESYAEFLQKNFSFKEAVSKRRGDKRNVMKTKIGQYKPPSPKRVSFNTIQEAKGKPVIMQETKAKNNNMSTKKTETEDIKDMKPNLENKHKTFASTVHNQKLQGNSTSLQESKRKSIRKPIQSTKFKDDVVLNQETKRKSITATKDTKLQGFTAIENIKGKVRTMDKPKLDFEYEVKEQQGDCNILILKI